MAKPIIRWDNVGISNSNSGTGALLGAIRGWENVTDSVFDLADRVKESRTDKALSSMAADGILSRDELGGHGNVDMKTILDAQRLDQNSREATQAGILQNALVKEQGIDAARRNSPDYIKRLTEREDAAAEVAKQNAEAAKLRAENTAKQLGITVEEAERVNTERDNKKTAETGFITNMTSAVNTDFGEGGRYSREVVTKKMIDQQRKGRVKGWEPTDQDLADINLAYENALPGLTDKSQQRFIRGYLRDPATAQNAKYLTDLPQYQRWDSTNQAVEQAGADSAQAAQDRVDDLFKGLEKSGGAFITMNASGRAEASEKSLAVSKGDKASYKANMLSSMGLKPEETAQDATWFDPGYASDEQTNSDGFDKLFSAAGGHTEIIQSILADPKIATQKPRWFGAAESWVDWTSAIKEAISRKKTYDDAAGEFMRNLPKNTTEQPDGNPVFQLDL